MSSGKYYISLYVKKKLTSYQNNSAIGIDLGITNFAILSDGQKLIIIDSRPKWKRKLKREQRKLSSALLAKNKGILI